MTEAKRHPLHRVCDDVFDGTYTDEHGVEIAKKLLKAGTNVDGYALEFKKDTPLIAACSLNADKLALLYLQHGANIHHAGTHGGTALHWAAWTGREKLVDALIRAGADVHKRCIDFDSTPLLWAVHGYKFEGGRNRHNQLECVRLLVAAGAERNTANKEGTHAVDFLDAQDSALREILRNE